MSEGDTDADAGQPKTAGDALKQREDYLRLAIDTIPTCVWCTRPDGSNEFLNHRWLGFTGLRNEEAEGWGWMTAIHPEDRPGLLELWHGLLTSGKAGELEARLRRFDGVYRWFLFRAEPLVGEDGKIVKWYGTNTDIDDRKRAEKLLSGEKGILELIAGGSPLSLILERICRLVEDLCERSTASILLLDRSGKRLRRGAAPGFPEEFLTILDGIEIGPFVGSCGTAAYRKEQVIVCDIAASPYWADYRELAAAYGLGAGWSTPILSSEGSVLGVFGVFWREPCTPSPEHHQIINQITHLTSVAIERERSQLAISTARARFEGILEIAEDAIIAVDANQRILLFNQGAERVFGYDQAEAIGRSIDLLLPTRFAGAHPAHLEEFARSPDVARVMGQRRELFGLRKDGQEFPAEASVSKLDLRGELVFTIILRDITERRQAAEALRASELLARGQMAALTRTLDALVMEAAPDGLIGHVLRTIIAEFDAHSSSVWRRDELSGLMTLEVALEGGKLMTKTDPDIVALAPYMPMRCFWPDPEDFRAGKPGLLEDIRLVPSFPWRDHLLAQGITTVFCIPMLIAGEVEGLLGIRFTRNRIFRAEEVELARALANQAMLALELKRLYSEGRQAAVVAERNRVARDIHDTLAQAFTGVIMQLEAAKSVDVRNDMTVVQNRIERAVDLARSSLREARRSVRALRPRSLRAGTLSAALEDLIRRMPDGADLKAQFHVEGEQRAIPAELEEGLFRIAQESLTNAIKHANARNFKATLRINAQNIRLSIADDGRGFDPQVEHDGLGLMGMKERTEQMGGQFILESKAGQGTEILVFVGNQSAVETSTGDGHV